MRRLAGSALSHGHAVALRIACLAARSRASGSGAGDEQRWGRENAIWARIRGTRPAWRAFMHRRAGIVEPQVLSERRAVALARRLRRGNIKYPYLFAGPFGLDGTLPAYPFGELARQTFRIIREQHPTAVPLPWVGGVQGKQLRLDDPRWVATAIDEIARLLDALDVHGVHVDVENLLLTRGPDPAYPGHVNRFFGELRQGLPHAFVSTVIPSTASGVKPWKQQHSVVEVDELVGLVDQLAVLYYDTSIQDTTAFDRNLAIQVDHLGRWKAASPKTQLLVAVGTFVNGPQLQGYRNLRVESIEGHFAALGQATARHPRQLVDGTAVYCEWTTDAAAWSRLRPFLTATGTAPRFAAGTPGSG